MTKADLMVLVQRHGMKPLYNNEIERKHIGFSLLAQSCIPELDDLAKKSGENSLVYFDAEYIDGGKLGALYKAFPPLNWL